MRASCQNRFLCDVIERKRTPVASFFRLESRRAATASTSSPSPTPAASVCSACRHGWQATGMPESVSISYSCFFERMTRALELFNAQRMKEQDARAKELQLWGELFQALLHRTTAQALTPSLAAEPSHTNRRCDSLVMSDDERAAYFRRGDHGEHDDRETLKSEGTMLEAASPGLRVPPGLQGSNWIPEQVWRTLPPESQQLVRSEGKRRRQQFRRARNKRCATAEEENGPHPDLRWPSRQHGLCVQRSPQAWQHTQDGSFDYMWMTPPQLYV